MKIEPSSRETGAQALDRALALFVAVMKDRGRTPLGQLAERLNIPISTAHRLMAAFERQRLITRGARGRYVAGMGLAELGPDRRAVLIQASRPLLRRVARAQKSTAHLGILEADMVTYLVKEHGGGPGVFTRELMQLEAYCTGIGKVLLAGLDTAARERYLAAGPFVPLTGTTLTEPGDLRRSLAAVEGQGYAIDDAEMAENVHCVAVPVHDGQGRVIAAISLSSADLQAPGTDVLIPALRGCAAAIEAKLFGQPQP
ncbi:IclR family transcriptional regulator [Oleomonas cavernae]|uniref:IclR family transcriptional regulator n=1 Tax=Oleomonas cavernae TaxID=2320859 RepID=A0A418WUD7_9PROT|nr:IclR family transcriptional regulator [Oleomonas cavernae]RJF94786.1 IclR family transcriptional regulator [Oleomonas cavernae]